jgi:hypothetical protein
MLGGTRKLIISALAIGLGVNSAAFATADQPSLAGVWDGTIGDLPVRVCFDRPESGDPYGVYFYRSKLMSIPLIKDDKAPSLFSEGSPSEAKAPRWALTQSDPNVLRGTWKKEARTLPLRLIRVPVAGKGGPCSSMEFEQPRLQGLRLIQARAIKDGVAYTKLTLDHRGHFGDNVDVESFVLAGDTAPVRTINAFLKKPFDEKSEDSWLSCVRGAFPWGGEHHEMIEPRMIARRWVVVNHHWDGFCGGAHPDSSNVAETFDLTTGREIDVRDWFNPKAIKRTRYGADPEVFKTIQPDFRKLVIGRWKGDGDCADTIDTEEWWNIELNRTGFVFTPSLAHVVQACEEDFKVSFAKVAPYLTPEGKRNVAALQAEAASPR